MCPRPRSGFVVANTFTYYMQFLYFIQYILYYILLMKTMFSEFFLVYSFVLYAKKTSSHIVKETRLASNVRWQFTSGSIKTVFFGKAAILAIFKYYRGRFQWPTVYRTGWLASSTAQNGSACVVCVCCT